MSLSIWQILLVGVLFMLLFGRGKIPALMSDLAAGIKSFKAGIKDEDNSEQLSSEQPAPSENPLSTATRDAEKV